MGEDQDIPTVESQNETRAVRPGLIQRLGNFARTRRGKAAAVTAAAAAAVGTNAALANNHEPNPNSIKPVPASHETQSPTPDLKPDIQFNGYGQDGHPAPKLIPLESHDPITKSIQVVPSSNPYELTQQAIWLAAHPESYNNELSVLSIWNRGAVEIKEGTFYHVLKGSKTFTPAQPNNDGEAGKITLSQGQIAWIENPVILSLYKDRQEEPAYIMATLDNGPSTVTNIKDVYFIPLTDETQANYFAPKNFEDPVTGLAALPTSEVSIGPDGKFKIGQGEGASKISILSDEQIQQKKHQLGLGAAILPSSG